VIGAEGGALEFFCFMSARHGNNLFWRNDNKVSRMNARQLWSHILIIVGGIGMLVGAIDPLVSDNSGDDPDPFESTAPR
jgi:hypothetical protein